MSKLFRNKKEQDEFEKVVEKFIDNLGKILPLEDIEVCMNYETCENKEKNKRLVKELVKEYSKINAEMKTNGDCCIHLEGNPSVALLMALSIVDKLKIKLDLDDEDIEELKKATTVIDKEVF